MKSFYRVVYKLQVFYFKDKIKAYNKSCELEDCNNTYSHEIFQCMLDTKRIEICTFSDD